MIIKTSEEFESIKEISRICALVLKRMKEYAKPGMNSKELDEYGGKLLTDYGARSAPIVMYKFPGHTCISVNNEVAHGVPSEDKILREGDLINIDVSAELNGFYSDNGGSFVLGSDLNSFKPLVEASKNILRKVLTNLRAGMRISDTGKLIETEAKRRGYKVIKNLCGHGVGKSLHEEPHEILNYCDRFNLERYRKNSVIAVETFISTASTLAVQANKNDKWTLIGNKGGYVTQHEHTLIVTEKEPIILTADNDIWNW